MCDPRCSSSRTLTGSVKVNADYICRIPPAEMDCPEILMSSLLLWLIAAVILLLVFAVYYWRTAALKPELVYQNNDENRNMIGRLPRLTRRYFPTPWMINTHAQLIALGFKKGLGKKLSYEKSEQLTMADGGTTALHWLGLDNADDKPTLLVLHTITGSPHSMRGFMRDIYQQTGWRIVLCQRRGHGDLPLTVAKFNTMGDSGDLREQIDVIAERYPQSPLYAIGISAGSGLLVRYLGEEGEQSKIRGGMAYCPGYNIEHAFGRAQDVYSRMMAKKLLKQFVFSHPESFSGMASYQTLIESENLHELHQNIYECAGFNSLQEFMDAANPMRVFENIRVPVLILNAEDDPVCHIDNAWEYKEQIREMPQAILAVTRRGSHCAYFSGLTAQPWAHQLAGEYFTELAKAAD